MNAPLPEHVLRALQSVTLDDKQQRCLSRRHKYDGTRASGCRGFGGELDLTGRTA